MTVCRTIDVPAAKLFAALIDWGAWHRWMPAMPSVSLDPSGALAGTVGAVRTVTLPDGLSIRERLLACDETALSIAYGIEGKPPFDARAYRSSVRLLPLTGEDATVIEWTAHLEVDAADVATVTDEMRSMYQMFIDCLAAFGER